MTARFSSECVHLLDEAQGLTLEMAEAWLRAHGWTQDGVGMKGWSKPKTWVHGDSVKSLLGEIPEIARVEGLSVQAMLREMNPRLRQGPPSAAAIEAHENGSGYWLASSADPRYCSCLRVGYFDNLRGFVIHELAHRGTLTFANLPASWFFWPCDCRGSKVRWPVDEKGVML